MKIKSWKRLSIFLFTLFFSITGLIFCKEDIFAADGGSIYISVEKFTIGQGYLVEPREISISEGEKVSSVFERLMKEEGITPIIEYNSSYGWYLSGIENADNGNINVPECVKTLADSDPFTDLSNLSKVNNKFYPTLREFSYTQGSGWCYFVNNYFPNVGLGGWTAKDGDVIRICFTIYAGDLGTDGKLTLPNYDEITKKMAVYNRDNELCDQKGYQLAYKNALSIVTNMDNSIEQVQAVCDQLPTETQVESWIKEKQNAVVNQINSFSTITLSNETQVQAARKAYDALTEYEKENFPADSLSKLIQAEQNLSQLKAQAAAEQAAAEQKAQQKALQQALIKQNTPTKTTLKSVKKTGTKKAKLTWKKVKAASGYEIYMSTKKSSGYKKIKTIKKAKTVTFTKSGLKKKKSYYFKVRTYRTVNGVTYYGSYSNVKQVKIK